MQFVRRLNISTMRFFLRSIAAKIVPFAIRSDVGTPFLSASIKRNAFEATLIGDWSASILHVGRASSQPQIGNSVIRPDAVDMVQFAIRPRAIVHGPCRSVPSNKNIIDANNYIPRAIQAAYSAASLAFAAINTPRQASCDRIIGKKFVQPLNGYLCHAG